MVVVVLVVLVVQYSSPDWCMSAHSIWGHTPSRAVGLWMWCPSQQMMMHRHVL
jgi:hypothetical protein